MVRCPETVALRAAYLHGMAEEVIAHVGAQGKARPA